MMIDPQEEDDRNTGNLALLPALAEKIAEWFPELEQRALSVAESEVSKENQPTLPLAMLALIREVAQHSVNTKRILLTEDFLIEFWLEPKRYAKDDGGITPFWSFYDYDGIRDRLLTNLLPWKSPRGESVQYVEMTIDADRFATIITFRFRHEFPFCPLEPECDPCHPDFAADGRPVEFRTVMCKPEVLDCCPEDEKTEKEEDPCHPSYT